ncbi:MAG: hypothetical protein IPM96_02145 [Ignavibacteria bacterium]|nr:hypothetical protein [Ignavibacteria bacterium]
MKTNTELFDLIKSLSSSEKRYFKLNASVQKGVTKYLKLFDLIDSQKIYNEKALKSFKGNEDLKKNFNFTKNYLAKLIFKSLLNYKNEKSTDAKLFNMLQRCRILFQKALFRQHFKTVKAGKAIAEKCERFGFLLEFIEMERQLTRKEELLSNDIQKLFEYELKVLEKIREINFYKKSISSLLRIYRSTGIIRSEDDEKDLNETLSVIENRKVNTSMSVTSAERILYAQSIAHELKGDLELSYSVCVKRFKLISLNRNIFDESLYDKYRDSLLSVINSASRCSNFSVSEKHLKILKESSKNLEIDEIDININNLNLNLLKILNGKIISGKKEVLILAEKYLNIYRNKLTINTYNLIVYRLSSSYFFDKNYHEALRILNVYSTVQYSGLSPFLEPYLKMLNILIHYELDNYKLLKYMLPSAKKYLKSRKAFHKTEISVLNFISKMISTKNSNTDKLKSGLLNDFNNIRNDKYEKNAEYYFNYSKWIKNLLLNK